MKGEHKQMNRRKPVNLEITCHRVFRKRRPRSSAAEKQNLEKRSCQLFHYLLHSAPKSAHFSGMKESTQANESKATGQLTCHWVIFRERRSQQRRNEISQAMRRNIRNSSCKKQFQRRKFLAHAHPNTDPRTACMCTEHISEVLPHGITCQSTYGKLRRGTGF